MTGALLSAGWLGALPLCLGDGAAGIPVPYSPRMDDVLTAVLLGCFFLSSYVISRSSKFLLQLVKDFLFHRERTSIFATSTSTDMRYLLLLILQTCVLGGVSAYVIAASASPALLGRVGAAPLLGFFVCVALAYFLAKWLVYSLLGWIFFDTGRVSLWFESYSTLLYYLGFALFPFVLFIVYFSPGTAVIAIVGGILLAFAKILMFYKWVKLFCDNFYGGFLLIVYFCALEIMPFFVLYRGVVELTDLL